MVPSEFKVNAGFETVVKITSAGLTGIPLKVSFLIQL
jgi:hypothetical protein